MPLITCIECGREAVSATGTCPGCGKSPLGHACGKCGSRVSLSTLICKACTDRTQKERAAENLQLEERTRRGIEEWIGTHRCTICSQSISANDFEVTRQAAIQMDTMTSTGSGGNWVSGGTGNELCIEYTIRCPSCGQSDWAMVCPFCGNLCDNRTTFSASSNGGVPTGECCPSTDHAYYLQYRMNVKSCTACACAAKKRMADATPVGRGGKGCLAWLPVMVGLIGLVVFLCSSDEPRKAGVAARFASMPLHASTAYHP